ncbi:MAG: hypothetical protein ACJ8F1_17060 [Polyangia bacterium]
MGFKLVCDNGETYTIRFWKSSHVQVIDVAPARCAMSEIVFSNADGGIEAWKQPPPGLEGAADFCGRDGLLPRRLRRSEHARVEGHRDRRSLATHIGRERLRRLDKGPVRDVCGLRGYADGGPKLRLGSADITRAPAARGLSVALTEAGGAKRR